jgi:hypothetical protein
MHAADAVLSGGVRRSATICLFSHDDEEMMKAKTGNWFIDNPQRGRSNNSAVIVRNEISKEDFSKLMTSIKEFGEPGFYFVEDKDFTTNPRVVTLLKLMVVSVLQKKSSLKHVVLLLLWVHCRLVTLTLTISLKLRSVSLSVKPY